MHFCLFNVILHSKNQFKTLSSVSYIASKEVAKRSDTVYHDIRLSSLSVYPFIRLSRHLFDIKTKTEHITEQYMNFVQHHVCLEAISLEEIRDKTKKKGGEEGEDVIM